MKKLMILSLVLMPFFSLCHANNLLVQSMPEGKLWEIRAQDGSIKGYILGTMHFPVDPIEFFQRFPKIKTIIENEVTDIAVENPFLTDTFSEEELVKSRLDCNKGLGNYLSDSQLVLAQNHLQKNTYLSHIYDLDDLNVISCIDPEFAIGAGIEYQEDSFIVEDYKVRMDEAIIDMALKNQHRLHYLEGITGFQDAFSSLERDLATSRINSWLSAQPQTTLEVSPEEFVECYYQHLNCSLPQFIMNTKLMHSLSDIDYKYLVEIRNRTWIKKIEKLLTENKITFIVVGLMHIYDLIKLIESNDYAVENSQLSF